MPPPETIQEIITRYQQQLAQRETAAVTRLVDSYQRIYDQLSTEQDALLQQIDAMRARGEAVTAPMIHRLQRYQKLLTDTEREVNGYGAIIGDEVRAQVPDAATLGVDMAAEMVQASLAGLPPDVAQGIFATFDRMPSEAVEAMVGAMLEDSPLWTETLASLGEETARDVGDTLIRGLLSGKGPRDVGRAMTNTWGVPLTRAMTIARTEQLRAHRMASLASYRLNSHIVKSWTWHAELDGACAACVALHGRVFPLSEEMADHVNGKCSMLPNTPTWAELGFTDMPETGTQAWIHEGDGVRWFEEQPEETQREVLGASSWRAWKDGAVEFGQFIQETDSPRWGKQFTQASLVGILGDGARQYYGEGG